jgi:predicted dehydrogenase
LSFGSSLSGSEQTVSCENGSVTVGRSSVTVRQGEQKDGKSTEKLFPEEGSGVKQEVAAWAKSIVAGKQDPAQSPEEALADLEILEKLLRSGEAKGKPFDLEFQI